MCGKAAQWEEEEKKTRGRVFTGLGNRIHEAARTLVETAEEHEKNNLQFQ